MFRISALAWLGPSTLSWTNNNADDLYDSIEVLREDPGSDVFNSIANLDPNDAGFADTDTPPDTGIVHIEPGDLERLPGDPVGKRDLASVG